MRRVGAYAAALTGAGFVAPLLATRRGIGVNPDSVDYFVAAESMARGAGLVDITGQALTTWPPGYPVVLWLGTTLGLTTETTARLANAASLAAVVWLTFLLLRRHVTRGGVVLAGVVLVVAARALVQPSHLMLSETLFSVAVVGFTLTLEHARARPRTAWLLVAAVLVWIAFLLRYAGAFLVPAGAIVLALGNTEWRRRMAASLTFTALAAVVPTLWILHNTGVDAPTFGVRFGAGWDVGRFTTHMGTEIGYLVSPDRAGDTGAFVVALALVGGMAAVLVATRARTAAVHATTTAPVTTLLVVTLTYTTLLVVSNVVSGSDLSRRLLAPMFPLLVVLGCQAYSRAEGRSSTSRGRMVMRAVRWGLVLFLAFQVLDMARLVYLHGRQGRGYAAPRLQRSALLRDLPRGEALLSNDPWAVAYVAHRWPVSLAPRDEVPGLSHVPVESCDLVRAGLGDASLVWFDDRPRRMRRAPRFAVAGGGIVELTSVAEHSDGTLYHLARPGADLVAACPD